MVRSLQPLYAPGMPGNYYYAVHHPSFTRLAYGFVLHCMGVTRVDGPLVNYDKDVNWNIEHGAMIPRRIGLPLRLVNAAFLSGMIVLVYLSLAGIFANRLLAVLGCLPLLWNCPIRDGACPYIGADAALLFWMAAFWFVWLWAREGSVWRVLALGLVGGVLASTKVNGAFALAGACVYYAAASKGAKRLFYPAILVVVPAAVFLAMNPIYRAGDLKWGMSVAGAMLDTMFHLKEATASASWAHFTKTEIMREAFPYWFFAVGILAVLATARREKWFWPTAALAASVAGLNAALIYVPMLRYNAPISMTFLVLFDAASIHFLLRLYNLSTRSRPLERGD